MTFAIECTRVDEQNCVAVAGEVDAETAPQLRDALLAALADAEAVVVDLDSVTFMDSSGLSALLVAHRAAEASGGTLRLRDVPGRVMKLLTITGLDELLTVETAPADDSPDLDGVVP
jgi:anti-sigma B factor antagonist